jgi:hypothetical protein
MIRNLTRAQLDGLRWVASQHSVVRNPLVSSPRITVLYRLRDLGLLQMDDTHYELTEDGVDAVLEEGFTWDHVGAWLATIGRARRDDLRAELARVETKLAIQDIRESVRTQLGQLHPGRTALGVVFRAKPIALARYHLDPTANVRFADEKQERVYFGPEVGKLLADAYGLVQFRSAMGINLATGRVAFWLHEAEAAKDGEKW